MSFTAKQWIFLFLVDGGAILLGTGLGLYQAEGITFVLCAAMFLLGSAMMIGGGIFLHLKMRCSCCHRIYPLYGWWGMENCPYCGEYFD